MNNQEDKIIEKLILDGAIEFAGVESDTGEILYNFTPKLKEIMPDLYNIHLNQVNSEIMNLWEMGFLNIDLTSDSPVVTINEKALDINEISKLSKEQKWSLEEIKRLYKLK